MLVILRIVFGVALVYQIVDGARNAGGTGEAGDLTGAWYLVICVGLAILNALVWAPYLGNKVSGPLTGMITESTYVERINWVIHLIRWLDARGYRRAVVLLCFLEGVRYPSSPAAFAVGFKNARPGSWLEKVYAREVFRFNNTQSAIQAYLALKRHGMDPRPHHNQEVNVMLMALEKPPRADAPILPVPAAPKPAPLKRNPGIRLFKQPGDAPPAEETASTPAPVAQGYETPPEQEAPPPPDSTPGSPPAPAPAPGGGTLWHHLLARVVAFLRAN